MQLEPAVQSAPFDVTKNSLLIRAGAGAGKTTLLIKTFISFCQEFEKSNKRLPRIAITTFTRKATQEVKERLSIKALESKDEGLFQHINKKSAVHISTIHGLLTLLVQDNADVLGLPQTIKIMDQNVYKKNLKRLVRQQLKKSPESLEILEHYSFIRLIDLIIQAMEAFRQRPELKSVSADQLRELTRQKFSHWHMQLISILRSRDLVSENWGNYFDYLQQLSSAIESASIETVLEVFENKPTKPKWNKKKPAFPEEIHSSIEEFWEDFDLAENDTEAYFNQHELLSTHFLQLVQDVFTSDSARKSLSGEITINDLELYSAELVRNHPLAVKEFSNKFDYYMIDEFQDTSPLQVEILERVIGSKPHFIVGDPQQSIYLFRGARSEVFLIKQKQAASDQGQLRLQYLDTNYRSSPSVMNFINDYFQHMSSQFDPMKTHPEKDITKSHVQFIQSENEAAGVLQRISQLFADGISPKDICVLSRRNHNLIKVAALAQKVHIPVQLQISAGFDQKREVLDLISMVKFLVNPHDNENLVLLLRSPWAYISDLEIAAAAKIDRSLWYALNQTKAEHPSVIKLNDYFSGYQKFGVSEAFTNLIKQCRFLDYSETYDTSGKREANFWKFFSHLKNAERNQGFSLGRYINENFQFLQSDLGSSQSEAVPVAQPDRVSLMTIHASKGLEFPHVIVVGFSEAPLLTLHQPLTVSIEEEKLSLAPFVVSESKNLVSRWGQKIRKAFNQKETEEHERLLYVALTRAQAGLSLVAETKSRQFKASWQNKSMWPAVGTHEHEHYNLVSSVAGLEVDAFTQVKKAAIPVSPKLIFSNQTEQSASVTDSLDSSQSSGASVNYNQKIADILKAKKGTDLHRLFESLQIYTQNSELYTALQKNLSPEQKKAIHYLLSVDNYPLQNLIKNGHVEWGFGLKTSNGLLQGQIDLWGVIDNEIFILDYKTGSSQYSEKAFQQLLFYAHCLYKMNMLDFNMRINFIVTYPLEEKTLSQTHLGFEALKAATPENILSIFK